MGWFCCRSLGQEAADRTCLCLLEQGLPRIPYLKEFIIVLLFPKDHKVKILERSCKGGFHMCQASTSIPRGKIWIISIHTETTRCWSVGNNLCQKMFAFYWYFWSARPEFFTVTRLADGQRTVGKVITCILFLHFYRWLKVDFWEIKHRKNAELLT